MRKRPFVVVQQYCDPRPPSTFVRLALFKLKEQFPPFAEIYLPSEYVNIVTRDVRFYVDGVRVAVVSEDRGQTHLILYVVAKEQ